MTKGQCIIPGHPFAQVSAVQVGTILITDGDFACMGDREEKIVKQDDSGRLYIECEEKYHGLDGQESDDGKFYIGLWVKGTEP